MAGDLVLSGEDADEDELVLEKRHETHRTGRTISFHMEVDFTVEVVEPPKVHNAELKSAARSVVMGALNNLRLGVPTDVSIRVHEGLRDRTSA